MMKNGFTLAEVLITLAIIGIVAALTIPTLMTDSRYQLVSSRVAKFVSTTEDAALAQAAMNGAISYSDIENIVLYKSMEDIRTGTIKYDLKDGTRLYVQSGASDEGLAEDHKNTEKYGAPMAKLYFNHNVSGIPDVHHTMEFIMTNKGYIFPDGSYTCANAMFDTENNESNPWKLTKALAEGVCKCTSGSYCLDN